MVEKSRVGRQPINLPEAVRVEIKDQKATIFGPKGDLSYELPSVLQAELLDRELRVKPRRSTEKTSALWGLWRTLLNNAVLGVTVGFRRQLEMVGLGFRAVKNDRELELNVGFSHRVHFVIPKGVEVSVDKDVIAVTGIDKQLVGETAASIRRIKPPEPYKGKGIKYSDEVVRRKPGKTGKAAAK